MCTDNCKNTAERLPAVFFLKNSVFGVKDYVAVGKAGSFKASFNNGFDAEKVDKDNLIAVDINHHDVRGYGVFGLLFVFICS